MVIYRILELAFRKRELHQQNESDQVRKKRILCLSLARATPYMSEPRPEARGQRPIERTTLLSPNINHKASPTTQQKNPFARNSVWISRYPNIPGNVASTENAIPLGPALSEKTGCSSEKAGSRDVMGFWLTRVFLWLQFTGSQFYCAGPNFIVRCDVGSVAMGKVTWKEETNVQEVPRPPEWSSLHEAGLQILAGRTFRKAFPVALTVGTLLSLVNQGNVLLAGDMHTASWARVALNYVIPYLVSSYGYLLNFRISRTGSAIGATTESAPGSTTDSTGEKRPSA